ncbi:hypothetical protein C4D60_Mb04t29220 [Musa balbisiana]|uniref:Uncharacterized protein n=1 Tax=Musa balbisiana TaxID=52838 RepID=A0A4V4HA44_MUSBA|nr:hypothetical protein C4D60_Mb04t29220 [Musa balbisiana]
MLDSGGPWLRSVVSLLAIAAVLTRFDVIASLASLTRETGPKVVKGDPARKAEAPKGCAVHHPYFTPTISVSDSALKFTHFLYNLSPAGTPPRDSFNYHTSLPSLHH